MARCEDRSYFFLLLAIFIVGFGMFIFKVTRDCRDSQHKIQIKDDADAAEVRPKLGKNFPI